VNLSGITIRNGGRTDDNGGGGIYNLSTLTLINRTVSGTRVDSFNFGLAIVRGGGISNGGTITLINSTVSGNSAYEDGGNWLPK